MVATKDSSKILMLLVTILIVALVLVVLLILGRAWLIGYFDGEIWKMLTQFFLVTVLGGSVALFYRQVEYSRERRQSELNALADFHQRLVAAYNAAKLVRRKLKQRVRKIGDNQVCDAVVLAALIDDLDVAQLQLEALKSEVEARKVLFTTKRVSEALRMMEKALRDIGLEYESHGKALANGEVEIGDRLSSFVGSSREGGRKKPIFQGMVDAEAAIFGMIDGRYSPVSRDRA